tara:strand:+ start:3527 stop:4225 length:699 start_codon:yes stop_codon:yes gene_type:complete
LVIEKISGKIMPQFEVDKRLTKRDLLSYVSRMGFWWFRSWKLILRGRVPRMLFLGRGVSMIHLRNIRIGRFVRIHEGAHLSGLGSGELRIGDFVKIGPYSRIVISETYNEIGTFIDIGDRVGISDFAHLGGAGGLTIGEDTIIGPYFSCHPEGHNFDDNKVPIRLQGVSRKGITIGNNCWIGAKVAILDGVEIGDGSVIAAGAIVNKSFPPKSVIGGVPAKIISRSGQDEEE